MCNIPKINKYFVAKLSIVQQLVDNLANLEENNFRFSAEWLTFKLSTSNDLLDHMAPT